MHAVDCTAVTETPAEPEYDKAQSDLQHFGAAIGPSSQRIKVLFMLWTELAGKVCRHGCIHNSNHCCRRICR